MGFEFKDLNAEVRKLMVEELELDIDKNSLYISPRLTEKGQSEYPELLRRAFSSGNDVTLSDSLSEKGILKTKEQRKKPKGGYAQAKVPVNAHKVLAEGEFNRFYIRAVCRQAMQEGAASLEVYRAKNVVNPRPESEDKIGNTVDPESLLTNLRQSPGVDPALGVPSGPNSGLSVRRKRD